MEANNEYKQLVPKSLSDARYHAGKSYLLGIAEPIEVGGVTYTPADIAAINEAGELYELGTQILADAGYTRDDASASYEAQDRYLADHPDLAQYKAYQDAVNAHPGGHAGLRGRDGGDQPRLRPVRALRHDGPHHGRDRL